MSVAVEVGREELKWKGEVGENAILLFFNNLKLGLLIYEV
jgi:hypothetical protein